MSLCFFFHPLNIHNKRVVLFSEFTKRLLFAPFHPENEGSNGTLRVDSRGGSKPQTRKFHILLPNVTFPTYPNLPNPTQDSPKVPHGRCKSGQNVSLCFHTTGFKS